MVTILDIAKEAQVSHGTVSNVLNKKGNVSVTKIKKVEDAAKKLGYSINYTAKNLRKGVSSLIAVILPNNEDIEYIQFFNGLSTVLEGNNYTTKLYYTHDNEIIERHILEEIARDRVAAVFAVSCLKDANEYYEAIAIAKTDFFFIDRRPKNAFRFLSFNYFKVGENIATYLKKKPEVNITIFFDDSSFFHEIELVNGLGNLNLNLVPSSRENDYRHAFDIINTGKSDVIITTTIRKARLLQKAMTYCGADLKKEIIAITTYTSFSSADILSYYVNYYQLGMEAGRFYQEKKLEESYIAMPDEFCVPLHFLKRKECELKFLTIEGPSSEAIKKLLPNFKQLTGIDIKMDALNFEAFNTVTNASSNDYDIIRLDMAVLPWLGEKLYQPLEATSNKLTSIVRHHQEVYQNNYMSINNICYALPHDPSVQMLFYRKDVFGDPVVKRTFFELYNKELALPQNFQELSLLNHFFASDEFNYENIQHGISLNVKTPTIIAAEFLAIYYSLSGHFKIENNVIQLDKEIAEEALRLYRTEVEFALQETGAWWNDSVESYIQGRTVMIIGFTNHLSKISESPIGVLTDYIDVPGNKPLLGGGVIGISKTSKKVEESTDFLYWLTNRVIAQEITLLGGTTANKEINKIQEIHQHYPWLLDLEDKILNGVRQNKVENGLPVDIRKVEDTIGSIIEKHLSEKNLINLINETLSRI